MTLSSPVLHRHYSGLFCLLSLWQAELTPDHTGAVPELLLSPQVPTEPPSNKIFLLSSLLPPVAAFHVSSFVVDRGAGRHVVPWLLVESGYSLGFRQLLLLLCLGASASTLYAREHFTMDAEYTDECDLHFISVNIVS